MIMADLKTNYVDDVLDTTKNQLRKYQQIQNDDGTVSFVDVTEYTQVGTSFGAKDINDTNAAINDVNGKLQPLSGDITITGVFSTKLASGTYIMIFACPNAYKILKDKVISIREAKIFNNSWTSTDISSTVRVNVTTARPHCIAALCTDNVCAGAYGNIAITIS